ncbi:unnamed protein product, partial [Polarella glacialis]
VFERRLTAELLDGLLASGSAEREEIRHQLEPLCSSLGLESDEVMMDYVLELAESLGASGAEARLERAAAVLQCIPSAERRARCVVHLLRHWEGGQCSSSPCCAQRTCRAGRPRSEVRPKSSFGCFGFGRCYAAVDFWGAALGSAVALCCLLTVRSL